MDIGVLKRRWSHELEPIKVMLVHRKRELAPEEWIRFVELTKKSVLRNPDQYLENNFPRKEILDTVIPLIFDDFLKASNSVSPLLLIAENDL